METTIGFRVWGAEFWGWGGVGAPDLPPTSLIPHHSSQHLRRHDMLIGLGFRV